VIDAEGAAPRRISFGGSSNVRPSWSHDGAWVYFGSNRSGGWEIWKSSLEGPAPIQVIMTAAARRSRTRPVGSCTIRRRRPRRGSGAFLCPVVRRSLSATGACRVLGPQGSAAYTISTSRMSSAGVFPPEAGSRFRQRACGWAQVQEGCSGLRRMIAGSSSPRW
jgi:hypothetical protein